MKRNEIKELHTKTAKELFDMLAKLRSEIFDVRLELSQNKLKNTSQLGKKLDDVARIQTILQRKESPIGGSVK